MLCPLSSPILCSVAFIDKPFVYTSNGRKGISVGRADTSLLWEVVVQNTRGGLTLAGCWLPSQLLSHSAPQQDGGGEKKIKSLWTKTGRSLASYCNEQNNLDLGKNRI